ncbi:MAG: M20 family metallopeptidase [Bacteroidia bacterium]|nr:M20 family metallopeptidase [Bacteroidia bacterium]
MLEKIKNRAQELLPRLTEIRRDLHTHPELSFEEFETQKKVENYLQNELGLKTHRIANTGVVALIEGKNPSKRVIGLRADMDALPIVEVNDGRPYRSQNEGVMHACGHDAHTTCLLGAATILNEMRESFEGTVKLIFQPGEEKIPGGASLMIKDGVLENPKVDIMIGQHVMPFLETGQAGFRKGLYMASADELYITVKGKGGHGALPHLAVDPILIASHMIVALQQVVSRIARPTIPSVLTFGKITGMGATNVIPSEVKIEGTFRTLDEAWRDEAHKRMVEIAKGIVEGMGGELDFQIARGYPFLKNEESITENCILAAKEYLGESQVKELDIWMAAEDFSYFSQAVPSVFYRLGTGNAELKTNISAHNSAFNIDEAALANGAGMMAYLVFGV